MAKKVWKRDFEEMESRNFLIAMQTGYEGQSWKKAKDENVELLDSIWGYRLWGLEGFRKYSRKVSWFVKYRYLCGTDCGQVWAIRVPGTISNVRDAIEYMKPAEVKGAKGKVMRQGDVFIVQKIRDCKSFLPHGHQWDAIARTLTHPQHGQIQVDFPCKFVQAKSLKNTSD